ncbi:LPS assembly lipoprotein LptE [Rhodoplanes sp. TEM]|uniref:LPS assembly lipoprotein LptE n=1 Tax=Rhodoplanes tepidamans TaxID=200616 RepID=A0ABT5J3N0_RHOTP|nr:MULTISPECIES: LPS assembly lipoprotein LptE [Rhodoplanes]MDC7784257.1 LPS assembly lipoprotein LptE [Rhodoplanes tepidamans]MDC7983649.1 LPS assembly lipoprotein LptE [Rhodoplanes sp. TEM]MDQ0353657.1 LPS-assembly lipoprotein [Rhodoplanes tepidamans]
MWWLDRTGLNRTEAGRTGLARTARVGVTLLALALPLAGCFQPLYGSRTLDGGPSVNASLSQVDIAQIPAPNGTAESRIAVELRNQLVFGLSGGNPAPPTHRLDIRITTSRVSVIVDTQTARPDVENFGITASYSLVDLNTGKPVVTDQAFSRVSYDIPGQQQRFARQRALRDAENRAAGVIAETIRSRLASYFVAGT